MFDLKFIQKYDGPFKPPKYEQHVIDYYLYRLYKDYPKLAAKRKRLAEERKFNND
jgi:hypothetical protein